MKYAMQRWLLFFSMSQYLNMIAISTVYNFRIAQITKRSIFEPTNRNHMIIGLLFDTYQKKYNDTHQNFIGGLGAFIYNFKPYYFRVDSAVSGIHEGIGRATTFSGADTDDILLTAGRNFEVNNKAMVTVSGLFGIPTHKVNTLKHVDFGYGQIGIGVQLDGSYTFKEYGEAAFLYGTRYIYFVPRTACDDQCNKYTFTIGNIADVLVAVKNYWNKHGLEVGYTARSDFGARICPHKDDIVNRTNYLRSNFYAVYKYKFLVNDIGNRFLFNIGYGFDHNPKIFSNKYIVTVWASWTVSF